MHKREIFRDLISLLISMENTKTFVQDHYGKSWLVTIDLLINVLSVVKALSECTRIRRNKFHCIDETLITKKKYICYIYSEINGLLSAHSDIG